MARTEKYQIVDGPSKFDLMLSLLDGDSSHRRLIIFRAKDMGEFFIQIDSLEREDGSGESWNFTGIGQRRGGFIIDQKIRGYFTTRSRHGCMFVDYPA